MVLIEARMQTREQGLHIAIKRFLSVYFFKYAIGLPMHISCVIGAQEIKEAIEEHRCRASLRSSSEAVRDMIRRWSELSAATAN